MRILAYLRTLCIILVGCFLAHPLQAQLDPRLQTGTTDLLDLYQQSVTAKAKPEVLTIFDFSGSMQTLMYHAQYPNTFANDNDVDLWMKFKLYCDGSEAVPGQNDYTIQVESRFASAKGYNSRVYTSLTVNVGGDTTPPAATQWLSKRFGNKGDRYWVHLRVVFTHYPTSVGKVPAAHTFAARLERKVTKTDDPDGEVDSRIPADWTDALDWTVIGGSRPTPASTSSNTTIPPALPSAGSATLWTSPAFDEGVPSTKKWWVETTIRDAYSDWGNHFNSRITSVELVKPDGSVVGYADADLASTASTTTYRGAGFGKEDVRNWVRAASHARFVSKNASNVVLRTLDIPIPWKNLGPNSTGSPLSSQTVPDPGSGLHIETDLNYKVNGGGEVLEGGTSKVTTTKLLSDSATGVLKKTYLDWLFNGKYLDGMHKGKYIAFDAMDAAIVGGQIKAEWGRGFYRFADTDTLTVPKYVVDPATGNEVYKEDMTVKASARIIPARTRVQAVKEAAIRTWIKFQDQVLWAYRFLDPSNEANSGSATNIDQNSTKHASGTSYLDGASGNASQWVLLNNLPNQSKISGNSVQGMERLAYLFASGSTPLTYAMARGLAQFGDPNSVFNAVQTGIQKPSDCMNHYLMLFSDGVDNNGGSNTNNNMETPYLEPVTGKVADDWDIGSAIQGNKRMLAAGADSKINRNGAWWNLFTFAAIGAHLGNSAVIDNAVAGTDYMAHKDPANLTSSGTPSTFLPFALKFRGSGSDRTEFSKAHTVTTMTVGVSLGGKYNDSGAKRRLFLAAAMGDPTTKTWDVSKLRPFESYLDNRDPLRPRQRRVEGTVCFFDATDPDKLLESLDTAFTDIGDSNPVNTSANPNVPFVGAALGKQVYIGKFARPAGGACLWPGDLMMFPTMERDNKTVILGKDGKETAVIDTSTAQWSAAVLLQDEAYRGWKDRKLYTLVPGASTLQRFTDLPENASKPDEGLWKYVATGEEDGKPLYSTEERKAIIQYAAGGDIGGAKDAENRPQKNRKNPKVMGDIINSAPAWLEYKWSDIKPLLASYSPRLAAFGADPNSKDGATRFRIVFVGTNQGWLHAFGEVTRSTTIDVVEGSTVRKQSIVQGEVDELWSFMPTDFLANLNYIIKGSNTHRFMVDGSPSVYFLDLPPTTGGPGNDVFDFPTAGSTRKERAAVIFGLRKGGRSYYAIDLENPFTPRLAWSLRPDEAGAIPAERNLTGNSLDGVQSIVSKMGFSTTQPAVGRVLTGSVIRDAVFLGGGLSVPELESQFGNQRLGRSVLALEAHTGKILSAVDLDVASIKGTQDIGPVSAGVVPFEFVLNSGLAQRAYFLDAKGSLWSWGSRMTTQLASYKDFRVDSSDITKWTTTGKAGDLPGIRRVYRDSSGLGAQYSTLPAPFRIGAFPGAPKPGSGTVVPPVVGVAMVSGDRNNPLDTYPGDTIPARHRLTVVFDRQDSRAWGFDSATEADAGIADSDLQNFSGSKITEDSATPCTHSFWKYLTPSCESFYLAPFTKSGTTITPVRPKFGYFVNFPEPSGPANAAQGPQNKAKKFIPKGINTPNVVARNLFYSYFKPDSADVCSGGSGTTYAWSIADAILPIQEDQRTDASGKRKYAYPSGMLHWWMGLASDFFGTGTSGVIQAGTKSIPNPDKPTEKITTLELRTASTANENRAPRARVWRTVY